MSFSQGLQPNTSQKELGGHGVIAEQTMDTTSHKYLSELDLSVLKEEGFIPTSGSFHVPGSIGKAIKKDELYKKPDPTEENITTEKKKSSVVTGQLAIDKTSDIVDLTKNLTITKASPLPTPMVNVSFNPLTSTTAPVVQREETSATVQSTLSKDDYPIGGSGDSGVQKVHYPTSGKIKKTAVRGYPGPRGRPVSNAVFFAN